MLGVPADGRAGLSFKTSWYFGPTAGTDAASAPPSWNAHFTGSSVVPLRVCMVPPREPFLHVRFSSWTDPPAAWATPPGLFSHLTLELALSQLVFGLSLSRPWSCFPSPPMRVHPNALIPCDPRVLGSIVFSLPHLSSHALSIHHRLSSQAAHSLAHAATIQALASTAWRIAACHWTAHRPISHAIHAILDRSDASNTPRSAWWRRWRFHQRRKAAPAVVVVAGRNPWGAPYFAPVQGCVPQYKGGVSNEAQTRGRMGWKVRGSGEGREGNEKVGRAAAVCVSSQQRELEQVHMQTICADQHLATTPSKDRGWAG